VASSARGRQETSDNPDDSRSRARPQRLRIDDTLDRILDPEPDTQATRLRDRLEHELHECDKQIAKCRALLDDDVDLATVSGWLKEADSTLADRTSSAKH